MIKKLSFIALCLALLVPAAAPAAAAEAAAGHRTELLSQTSVPLSQEEARAFFGLPDEDPRVVVIPAVLIIMAGAKVWNVIMDNRPTADIASAYASAIPGFDFNWDTMQDWRKVTKRYRFSKDTFLQGRAVDIVYEVSFFHGAVSTPGQPGKKGHYIANFTVKPLDIKLKWGWKISLQTSMSDPMNIGTPLEPVAWLNADLLWKFAKPLSTDPEIGVASLSVDGLGNLTESVSAEVNISPAEMDVNREPAPSINWN